MLRRCSSIWLACAALGATRVAGAEPKQSDITFAAVLEYVAPSSCPSVDAFKSLIVGRIGFDPFSEQAPQHVLVVISDEPRLEGRIEWRDAQGKWAGDQAFPAKNDDCSELVRAMGFALAVQIHLLAAERSLTEPLPAPSGPEHATAASEKPSAPPSPPSESREGAPDSSAAEPDGRRHSVPLSFMVGMGGSLALGMAPGVMPLGRLFGGIAYGAAWFELGGEISTRVSEFRADGAGFSQRALLVSAAGCGSYGMFSACVLGKGGVIQVEGEQIDVPASPTGSAFQVGLRLGAREELGGSVFFAQRLEGLVNVTRWTVRLDTLPVWTAPPVAGVLGLDVGLTFR